MVFRISNKNLIDLVQKQSNSKILQLLRALKYFYIIL